MDTKFGQRFRYDNSILHFSNCCDLCGKCVDGSDVQNYSDRLLNAWELKYSDRYNFTFHNLAFQTIKNCFSSKSFIHPSWN